MFRFRKKPGDWIVTIEIGEGRRVNFCCSKANLGKSEFGFGRDIAVKAAIKYQSEAQSCWDKYIYPAWHLDPAEPDEANISFLNGVLLRSWFGEAGFKDRDDFALIVTHFGAVWEIGEDYTEGWSLYASDYPGEDWPIDAENTES